MNAPVKLGLFGLGLLLIFAASLGAGSLVGPLGAASGQAAMNAEDGHNQGHQIFPSAAPATVPGGLQVAQDGYRLDLQTRALSTVDAAPFTFSILGPDGKPLTGYTTAHEKDLHLIVVRRDLTGFQHVHPVLGEGGLWSVPPRVGQPGQYRVFADFQPAGKDKGLILGADVAAPGDYQPQPLPPVNHATQVDGYSVTLDGELIPGASSKLTLTVSKDGKPVTDLQPYLGAFGHLVALRDGDLAYLHVHPEKSTHAGPQIVFYAEVPSTGSYGLFLDFQHQGTVRTAAFTAATHGLTAPDSTTPAGTTPRPAPVPSASGHGHGH